MAKKMIIKGFIRRKSGEPYPIDEPGKIPDELRKPIVDAVQEYLNRYFDEAG